MDNPTHVVYVPLPERCRDNDHWHGVQVTLPGLRSDSPPDYVEVYSNQLKAVTFFPEAWLTPLFPAPRRASK